MVSFGASEFTKSNQSLIMKFGLSFATQGIKASRATTEPNTTSGIHDIPLNRVRDSSLEKETVDFEFVTGSLECAALFRRKRRRGNGPVSPAKQGKKIGFDEILKSLRDGWWDPQSLTLPRMSKNWLPLMVLGTAAHTYKGFPDVSVSMDLILPIRSEMDPEARN